MPNFKITGALPALVTPLCADNKTINTEVARDLIDLHISQGASGFYVLGGTGEGLVLNREQREVMCEAAISHVDKRLPVIIHIAAMNLAEAIELAKHAERMGADAISAVPPCFFSYDDNDLCAYYKALASAVHIPLIIYYHPGAQKVMSPELITRIFEIDNVTGVKWSSGDLYGMIRLKDMTQGDLNIINGPDELFAMGLMAGSDAGIGTSYNVMLPEFVEIYNAFKRGDFERAHEVQKKVNRVIVPINKYEIIPMVKLCCELMGYPVGNATFPMKHYTQAEKDAITAELFALGFPFSR